MSLHSRRSIHNKLRNRNFREAFVSSRIAQSIATQARVLRQRKELSQADLARELGTSQNAIYRLENPKYGRPNISTLKKLASFYDVGLVVRFASFSEISDWALNLSDKSIDVPDFDHDTGFSDLEEQPVPTTDTPGVTLQQLVGKTGLGVPLSDTFFQAVNHPMLPPQYLRGGSMTLQQMVGLGLPTSAPTMLPAEMPPPAAPNFRHRRGEPGLKIVWRNERKNGHASNPSPLVKPPIENYFLPEQKLG
jgi:transcriptional regulator with XRE-family HTH domain